MRSISLCGRKTIEGWGDNKKKRRREWILRGLFSVVRGPSGAPAEASIRGTIWTRGSWKQREPSRQGPVCLAAVCLHFLVTLIQSRAAAIGRLFAAEWTEQHSIDKAEWTNGERCTLMVISLRQTDPVRYLRPTAALWHSKLVRVFRI